MLKHFLKIATRSILKYKSYSFINIFGLSLGMACTLLIILWVQDELSYDRFHKNKERLFRVVDTEILSSGQKSQFPLNAPALADVLMADYPEIEQAVRCRTLQTVVCAYGEHRFSESGILCADPAFLHIFTFPLVQGDASLALAQNSSIVISESMAKKYFGDEPPIGKIINIDNKIDVEVTGVLCNVPANSHITFDCIIPFQAAETFGFPIEGWRAFAYTIYTLLAPGTDSAALDAKIHNVVKQYEPESEITLSLQALSDIHLRSGDIWGSENQGDIRYVVIFSLVAGLVLFIACINFMNLSTARSSKRALEIGIRKVSGARRFEIACQFLGESLIMAIIALIGALIAASAALPLFNSVAGKSVTMHSVFNTHFGIVVVGTALITGIFAGIYPALLLSSFRPIRALKEKSAKGSAGASFRRVLVSLQFALTILLIISAITINRQLHFIRQQKLGFNQERVIAIRLQSELARQIDVIKNELLRDAHVKSVAAASYLPTKIRHSSSIDDWEGSDPDDEMLIYRLSADFDFAATLEMQIAEGRYFSKDMPSDTAEGIIVNESAVRAMGMQNPLGKALLNLRIIGVIKDFHFQSMHSQIEPLAIYFNPAESRFLLARMNPGNIEETLHSIKQHWQLLAPNTPFEYSFLDEEIQQLYFREKRIEAILNGFTALAIVIACLGLFGLASFTAEQRTKEIGVRKTLGASVMQLVAMLSKEFTLYILLANTIAWPLAWYFTRQWLQNFVYHISMSWWMFLFAGMSALFIALLTISWQALRAATANPVEALRYE